MSKRVSYAYCKILTNVPVICPLCGQQVIDEHHCADEKKPQSVAFGNTVKPDLGTLTMLRERLGGRVNGQLVVGRTYASALRKAAGIPARTRYFDVGSVIRWKKKHPEWKSTDVESAETRRLQHQCNQTNIEG